ncbi:PREDICTED: uncharacterized protein LOC107341345 isoform X1 [Acropora digitifera]|uniref:uncharacterized protein LOC107341345 isoform X1 n=1 Tax=Acropora digitifera TaxID=70779 RepID=UPI00077AA7D3|nr:PREDICTED: uncharacterized protein LOC107341345 isoform X1 [Acropora digitifera]
MDSQSRIKESCGKRPLHPSVTTTPERNRQNRDIPERVDHGTLDQGASLSTSNRLSSAMDSQSRIKESRGKRPLHPSVTTTPERKRQKRDISEKVKRKGPSHPSVTSTERRQRQNAGILQKNRGKRPLHLFQTTTPERQRQNADIPESKASFSGLQSEKTMYKDFGHSSCTLHS